MIQDYIEHHLHILDLPRNNPMSLLVDRMEHTKSDSGPDPTKWAVLVGVDLYSPIGLEQNLKGCVNDAVLVYNFLRDDLKVPKDNMCLHLERNPESAASIDAPDPEHLPATKASFLRSLKNVMDRTEEGHFVHIHFSGHGDYDEVHETQPHPSQYLCFSDSDMEDVEFGNLLDDMARENKVTVLVTLDCCFSGGATRDHQPEGDWAAIRCKPKPGAEDDRTRGSNGEDDDPDRHITLQKGALYRDRHYTIMTACQPHEKCRELEVKGRKHGLFTSSLISLLKTLSSEEHNRHLSTYEMLQAALEVTIHRECDSRGKPRQNPTLFGPRSRVLFETMTLNDSRGFAVVTSVAEGEVKLNRGHVSGTKQGDKYRLSPLSVAHEMLTDVMGTRAIMVEVTDVIRAYDCSAKLSFECVSGEGHVDLQHMVQTGWLARLVERDSPVQALISHDEWASSAAAVKRIQESWAEFRDPTVPVDLVFPGALPCPSPPRFNVEIRRGNKFTEVEIRNSRGEPFPHLGKIPGSFPDLPRRVMGMLRHLQSYLLVSELESPVQSGRDTGLYDMTLSDADHKLRADRSTLEDSTRIMNFKNTAGQTLYVTVLNLTPLYGVVRLFPTTTGEGSGGGKPVDNGAWMRNMGIPITIEVPLTFAEKYRQSSDFEMKDDVKLFITTKPTDLRHYELDDLETTEPQCLEDLNVAEDGLKEEGRPVKKIPEDDRLAETWWVEKLEIATKGLEAGGV